MDNTVTRARSAIGSGCVYLLGHGGFKPASPTPWDSNKACDCSGFASWVLGLSRQTRDQWYVRQNGGWLETTAIAHDAAVGGSGLFAKVEWADALPGDLLVYGDHDGRQGHVGIVATTDPIGPRTAVHCSSSNYRAFGDAIRETGVDGFKLHGAIIARRLVAAC